MKKQIFIGYADIWLIVGMVIVAGLALCGYIPRGGTTFIAAASLGVAFYLPAMLRSLIHWLKPASTMLAWADWDARSDAMADAAQDCLRGVRNWQHKAFPPRLRQRGAIGRDLRTTARPTTQRGTGRQHGGASTAGRQAASGKSADDDDGPGEPPRLPLLFPLLPLLFTYLAFAQLIGCATKTLRNRVSAGLFPPPIQTVFGPRFTQAHLAAALAPQPPAAPSTPKKRGRPRIAQVSAESKGGAA